MSTLWKEMLTGKGGYSSSEIQNEIERLKSLGLKMENEQPGFEKGLAEARKELLAEEGPGSFGKVQKAEMAISENKSKASAIKDILKDLGTALEKALTSEVIKKQAGIRQEIAKINDEVLEFQQKILKHFSAAAILVNKLHGNERQDQNLSYEFFRRCNLSTELSRQIAAGLSEKEGLSLYTQREQLTRQSEQLRKQSI